MEAQINQQQMLLTPVTGIKKRETSFCNNTGDLD